MDNRGSKSVIITVKEQRVDGSCTNYLVLRYTLLGLEINLNNLIRGSAGLLALPLSG